MHVCRITLIQRRHYRDFKILPDLVAALEVSSRLGQLFSFPPISLRPFSFYLHIPTYIHPYIHTYIHTYIHPSIHPPIHLLPDPQTAFPSAILTVALPDYDSTEEQISLIRNSSIFLAVEGGALDTLIYAPQGMTVVAIGRDPGIPHPIGCQGKLVRKEGKKKVGKLS